MPNNSKLKIFSGSANRRLSEEIAGCIGVPLGQSEVIRFSDGEITINIKESVRGFNVYLIQPTCPPANENIMELLILIDALKRASSKTVNVVIPYYGYARQDRKTRARDPITSKLVADLITAAGASRIVAMDLHAGQIQGFFNIPSIILRPSLFWRIISIQKTSKTGSWFLLIWEGCPALANWRTSWLCRSLLSTRDGLRPTKPKS